MEWRAPPDGDVLSARLRGFAATHCCTPEVSPSSVAEILARNRSLRRERRHVRRPRRSTVGNSPSVRGVGSWTTLHRAYPSRPAASAIALPAVGETRRLPWRRKRNIAWLAVWKKPASGFHGPGADIAVTRGSVRGPSSFEQLEPDEAIEQRLEGGVGWNVETRTQLPNARPRLAHVENLEDERID